MYKNFDGSSSDKTKRTDTKQRRFSCEPVDRVSLAYDNKCLQMRKRLTRRLKNIYRHQTNRFMFKYRALYLTFMGVRLTLCALQKGSISSRGVLRRCSGGSPQIMGRLFPASRSLLGACGSCSTPSSSSLVLLSWMSLSISASDSGVNLRNAFGPVRGSRFAILASRRDTTSTGNLYTKLLKGREGKINLMDVTIDFIHGSFL